MILFLDIRPARLHTTLWTAGPYQSKIHCSKLWSMQSLSIYAELLIVAANGVAAAGQNAAS